MQFPTLLISSDAPTYEELGQLIPFPTLQNNPDVLWLTLLEDKTSISIDQVHELISKLLYKPVRETYKVAIITPADRLTLPAQQALLKTLEEPPENTQLILATTFPAKLLPTILSRTIRVTTQGTKKEHDDSNTEALYPKLGKLSVTQCLHESDVWAKTREEAIEKLRTLLREIRATSHKTPSKKTLRDEKATIMCIEQLGANVHMKLALDNLFFVLSGNIAFNEQAPSA